MRESQRERERERERRGTREDKFFVQYLRWKIKHEWQEIFDALQCEQLIFENKAESKRLKFKLKLFFSLPLMLFRMAKQKRCNALGLLTKVS